MTDSSMLPPLADVADVLALVPGNAIGTIPQ